METIYLAGGCFWCTEAVFKTIRGVLSVTPGYVGGTTIDPTYEQVCSGATGHAEAVGVSYDPKEVSLSDLLEIFFESHDPTMLNQQGNDVGTQYRSAIFYTEESQKPVIQDVVIKVQKEHRDPVVTEVHSAAAFYPAESYHRDYYIQHSTQPYCMAVISPKLQKIAKKFPENQIS